MPEIGRIQSTNFQALLQSLGIVRNEVPFALRSEVTPVVLVGGTVSFVAAPTPAYAVTDLFTTGVQVAPAAGTVLADTGPLPAGAYSLVVLISIDELNSVEFEWRDAANAANLFVHRLFMGTPAGITITTLTARFSVDNDNERFRVLNVGAGGVGQSYQASIFART